MSTNISILEDEYYPTHGGITNTQERQEDASSCYCGPGMICCFVCTLCALGVTTILLSLDDNKTVTFTDCHEFELYSGTHDLSIRRVRFLNGCNCEKIVIGKEAFGHARVLEMNELNSLQSIIIGQNSFTYSPSDATMRMRKDGEVNIRNCPKLKSIQMGPYSFSDYSSLELANLPSLESIEVGNYGFFFARALSLSGLNERMD